MARWTYGSVDVAVKFIPSGQGKARCPPDPRYPEGFVLKADVPNGVPCCTFYLPYPAPECGWFKVECEKCGINILVSVAGRPDDPLAVILPCEEKVN
jgi:hypothetical protein